MSVVDSTPSLAEASEGRITAAAASLLRRAVGDAAVEYLRKIFRVGTSTASMVEELALIAEERKRADAFLTAMNARLDARLNELLHAPLDPTVKSTEWSKAVSLEQDYLDRHLAAVRARLAKAVEYYTIRSASPRGSLWKLGPAKNHTADCVYMAGKAWSWGVLADINPYTRHVGCQCTLVPVPPGMKVRSMVGPDFFLIDTAEAGVRRVGYGPRLAVERLLWRRIARQRRVEEERLYLHGHYIKRRGRWVFIRAE